MKNKQITDCIKNFDKVVEARRGGRGEGGGGCRIKLETRDL